MLTALIQTKRLTNASAHRSAYPPLLALEQEIVASLLKHDTLFAVCLFSVTNGALFLRKKLGLRLAGLV